MDLNAAMATATEQMIDAIGQTGIYGSITINLLYDRTYIQLTPDGMAVESTGPVAFCKTDDVAGASHGSTLSIGGAIWKVREVKPDGTGMTVLMLKS
jgi:hypothetical protein